MTAEEHWFHALLLGRKAGSFQVKPGGAWPALRGPGLVQDLSILATLSVTVDDSRWWLRVFGLRTLTVKVREGEDAVPVPAFVGTMLRVEQLRDEVLIRAQNAFANLGSRLTALLDALEADRQALFLPSRYVRHSQVTRLLSAHERLTSDEVRNAARIWRSHPMHAPAPSRQALDTKIQDAYAFLDATEEAREKHNGEFVAQQAEQHADYFATVESEKLTDEQVEASLLFDDANVTVAAAGSGKTSVMVSKVG